jgi:hypothetical protein
MNNVLGFFSGRKRNHEKCATHNQYKGHIQLTLVVLPENRLIGSSTKLDKLVLFFSDIGDVGVGGEGDVE